jgi:alpha-tubulin suppressor-like RCC1 family protein
MACPEIITIPKTECIGNSLASINNNFEVLKDTICNLESGITIQSEGTSVGNEVGTVNFIGPGVSIAGSGNAVSVLIPGFEQLKITGLEEQGINSGGGRNNFFIVSDGTIRVTGKNDEGELGIGRPRRKTGPPDRSSHVPRIAGFTPPLELDERVSKVYSQGHCTFILTNKGRCYGAGKNDKNQIGLGNTVPVIFTFINVLQETVTPIEPTTNPVFGYAAAVTDPVVQLATGSGGITTKITVFARTQSGKVYVWGDNERGQTGIGDNPKLLSAPVRVPSITNAVDIASSGNNGEVTVFVINDAGNLFVMGRNKDGQAGINNNNSSEGNLKSFVQVVGLPVGARCRKVRTGGTRDEISTWILLEDGSVWAAGLNNDAQITGTGDNSPQRQISFSRIVGSVQDPILANAYVEDIVAHCDRGNTTVWALIRDGDAYRIAGWGDNSFGQLGLGTTAARVRVSINPDWPWLRDGAKVRQVVVAGNEKRKTTLVLDTKSRLWTAGYGAQGLLGNGTQITTQTIFVRVAFNPILGAPVQIRSTNNDQQIGSGPSKITANFLVLLSTGKVLGWGFDEEVSGQLGVDPGSPDVTTVPSLVQLVV